MSRFFPLKPLRFAYRLLILLALFFAIGVLFVVYVRAERAVDQANETRHQSFLLADELRQSSDDLTRMVRTYVVTGNPLYKDYYQAILDIRDGIRPRPVDYHNIYWDLVGADGARPRPDSATAIPLLDLMRQAGFTAPELALLAVAKARSDALTATEFEAMRRVETTGPRAATERARAMGLLYDARYHQAKAAIMAPIAEFHALMEQRTQGAVEEAQRWAAAVRLALMMIGLTWVTLIGVTYYLLHETLGGSADEVHELIMRLGAGDFSSPLSGKAARGSNNVLGWLSQSRVMLGRLEQERQAAEAALQEAKAAAESASRAKTQFLAHMSHELRTPLNAILGFAQLLQHEPLTPAQQDMIGLMREAGNNLLNIIGDILDLSKIEAGQLVLDPQPFTLPPLLERLEMLFRHGASQKGLGFTVGDGPAALGALLGDAPRLEQVLVNLLGNAIKFTEAGAVSLAVEALSLTETMARLRFVVSDTGLGIEAATLARLFQPFNQGDPSITRRFGGTGLGLAISKRLVEQMGGALGATSEPGRGSTFWVEISLPRLSAAPESVATAALPPATGDTRPLLTGLRVLAVDDNAINLRVLERVLQRQGALVTLAREGEQALQTLWADPQGFDVILMDIQMPVMDGLTATRAIRAEPRFSTLPVIALTAGVLAEEREAALAAGMNDFLAKPLDLGQVKAMLARYLAA